MNKTLNILGYKLNITFFFSIYHVKKLTFNLPDWADDTCITYHDAIKGYRIKYYKGSTVFYIDLPKCKKADLVFLTPITGIVYGKRIQMTNRIITIDIYV